MRNWLIAIVIVLGICTGVIGLTMAFPKEAPCVTCMGMCSSHTMCLLGCHCAMDGTGSGWCVSN